MIRLGHVPKSFGDSYTVCIPILIRTGVSFDDFRGIGLSISPAMEHCIIDRYNSFFCNQWKSNMYSHAVYLCNRLLRLFWFNSLDLSKAFDSMNHHGLFVKLMKRQIIDNLLLLLGRCICIHVSWCNAWSSWSTLRCGIRQGVLCPCLFALYIVYSLVKKFSPAVDVTYVIIVYADDILLLAPSMSAFPLLFSVCEK